MATIPGSAADDVLLGTAGIDVITGLDGNDVLAGLDESDAINGGPGNDVILGGRGADTLVGDAGNDLFIWNNGDGSDLMDGAGEEDTQQVNGAPTGDAFVVVADPGGNAVFQRTNLVPFALTMNNVEVLDVRGDGGDDVFLVGDLTTTDTQLVIFQGGAGNDTFNAGGSRTSNIVFGGDGNDTITTGLGDDIVDGGTGADTIIYAGGMDSVTIELADVVQIANRNTAHVTLGNGFIVLDFGGGNVLDLHWQVGAFAAQDYYNAHFAGLVLV